MPARRRETQLTELIYTFHPRFAGAERHPRLGQGVPRGRRRPGPGRRGAGGRRGRADPARPGAERLARTVFDRGSGPHRARRADRPGPGHHAPGHHLHDGRRRRGGDVPERRRTGWPRSPSGRARTATWRSAEPAPFLEAAAAAMGIDRAAGDRHRPRPGHRRARAVGRRQQHPGDRAQARGRVRAERRDQRAARGGRDRGDRRSPGPSWAPAAAGRGACPARSAATPSLHDAA